MKRFQLAERHFGSIPSGPQPMPADIDEPPQIEERRGVVEEKFGTLPGIAIGYQAPHRLTPEWYAAAMLDQALHGGRAGRVYRKLVLEQQIAVDAEGGIHYPVGDLFDYNGPTLMVTRLLHKPEYSADQTIAALRPDSRRNETERNHVRGTGADQSEIPVELFFHARGRARRLHPALRIDALCWPASRCLITIRTW